MWCGRGWRAWGLGLPEPALVGSMQGQGHAGAVFSLPGQGMVELKAQPRLRLHAQVLWQGSLCGILFYGTCCCYCAFLPPLPPPCAAEGITLPFKAVALIQEHGRTRIDVTVKASPAAFRALHTPEPLPAHLLPPALCF